MQIRSRHCLHPYLGHEASIRSGGVEVDQAWAANNVYWFWGDPAHDADMRVKILLVFV